MLDWYKVCGRSGLPWRLTRDAYRITVSEFMLQQTQVERVLPLYVAFVARFDTVKTLAQAPLADVVRAWKGLGYNSRAVRLHRLARTVVEEHGGRFPRERDALVALPGIGAYTAAAIRAFAFDETDVAFDTNLRRVVHRVLYGFEHPPRATDAQLAAAVRAALPEKRSHDVNSALMDLGATICTARHAKCLVCPLREACAAAPPDAGVLLRAAAARSVRSAGRVPFQLTARFLRGRIVDRLRELPPHEAISLLDLRRTLELIVPEERLAAIEPAIENLQLDGIVETVEGRYRLAT